MYNICVNFISALKRLDNTIDDPHPDVIEKRLHSLLLLTALLLSASMTMLDLANVADIKFENMDINATIIEMSNLSQDPRFWMGCTLLPFVCEIEQGAKGVLVDANYPNHPMYRFKDNFYKYTSLSIHLSVMGLVMTMLCYLSLNHVHMEGASMRFWYKTHAVIVLGSYMVTGAGAICMCLGFDALTFLKGGLDLYLVTVQRTYLMAYCSSLLFVYLFFVLFAANSMKDNFEVVQGMIRKTTLTARRTVEKTVSPYMSAKNSSAYATSRQKSALVAPPATVLESIPDSSSATAALENVHEESAVGVTSLPLGSRSHISEYSDHDTPPSSPRRSSRGASRGSHRKTPPSSPRHNSRGSSRGKTPRQLRKGSSTFSLQDLEDLEGGKFSL